MKVISRGLITSWRVKTAACFTALALATALSSATAAAASSTSSATSNRTASTTRAEPKIRSLVIRTHGRKFTAQLFKPSGVIPQRTGGKPRSSGTAQHGSTDATVYPPTTSTSGLSYYGGPLALSPKVYLDFWGTQWQSDPNGVANYLENLFGGLGDSSDAWSTVMSQYTDTGGSSPTFSGGVLAGTVFDYSGPAPAAASQSDIANEADVAAAMARWHELGLDKPRR